LPGCRSLFTKTRCNQFKSMTDKSHTKINSYYAF
jgi:hypothetical protein